jgi:hypothetical protein
MAPEICTPEQPIELVKIKIPRNNSKYLISASPNRRHHASRGIMIDIMEDSLHEYTRCRSDFGRV